MVIKASELANEVRKNAISKIDEFCTKIDSGLKAHAFANGLDNNSHPYAITTTGMSGFVLNELIRLYNEAGWNVERHSDQRDGDYLSFKKKAVASKPRFCELDYWRDR